MKKLFSILVSIAIGTFLTASVFAQSPEKMSYQSVIRNAGNNLVVNAQIGMQISILQGTESGASVYTETQTPTTNANGLVNIQIGSGAVKSGTFATIDWANGPYFIKTEADPTGGTTYTITGTSQLLSVPYAMHATTAKSLVGSDGGSARYIGELYGGGVIFWLDKTGEHGLICSMVNVALSGVWSNILTVQTDGTNDWNGVHNTAAIIGQTGHTNSAAKLCDDYTNENYGTGVYSDWYLPSVFELNDLWNNIKIVTKAIDTSDAMFISTFLRAKYASSSELSNEKVWFFDFLYGYASNTAKSNAAVTVRAVRAF